MQSSNPTHYIRGKSECKTLHMYNNQPLAIKIQKTRLSHKTADRRLYDIVPYPEPPTHPNPNPNPNPLRLNHCAETKEAECCTSTRSPPNHESTPHTTPGVGGRKKAWTHIRGKAHPRNPKPSKTLDSLSGSPPP